MFYACDNLVKLDVSTWDTRNISNFTSAFDYCSELRWLNIASWQITDDCVGMFNNCVKLETLICRTDTIDKLMGNRILRNNDGFDFGDNDSKVWELNVKYVPYKAEEITAEHIIRNTISLKMVSNTGYLLIVSKKEYNPDGSNNAEIVRELQKDIKMIIALNVLNLIQNK